MFKMKLFRLFLIIIALFISIELTAGETVSGNKNLEAKINKVGKVLCIQIIEENWDALPEFHGKEKRSLQAPKKIEQPQTIFEYGNIKFGSAKDIIEKFKSLIDSKAKIVIFHWLKYIGIERMGCPGAFYSYKNYPKKIDLTTPELMGEWRDFREIRFVEDITIEKYFPNGDLKLKYQGKDYLCSVGSITEFPLIEKNLPAEQFFGAPLVEFNYRYRKNDLFNFKTKVTLVNYGYVEVN